MTGVLLVSLGTKPKQGTLKRQEQKHPDDVDQAAIRRAMKCRKLRGRRIGSVALRTLETPHRLVDRNPHLNDVHHRAPQ